MFAVHPLAPAVLIFLDLKKQPLVCIKEIQCISKFLIPPHPHLQTSAREDQKIPDEEEEGAEDDVGPND